jgi:Ca2+-binding EF-hand superfamily protein|eukprot:SAG25_NODE_318_length_9953_cov_9.168561_7_plen_52_part_00
MTKDQMKQKFDEVDSDHSGTIDKREIASFFAFLDIGLTGVLPGNKVWGRPE